MDKELNFDLLGIATMIKRNRYVVPLNQREYSWIAGIQVKNFLHDIGNAMRNPEKSYFLGTIVLTKIDKHFEISDGQQRLATTTMILAAIRDWFRKKGDVDNYKDIEQSFLFTFDRKQQDTIQKLRLNVDDNQYFKNAILQPYNGGLDTQRSSHRLIAKSSAIIKKYISDIEAQYGVNTKEYLNDWITYLEEKAKVVVLTVTNAEDAFIMFETLNDRGLKTSQVDLVKNYLFKLSGDRLQEAQNLWSSMRSSIETVIDDDAGILDFLRAASFILFGHTTKKEIMSRIKEHTTSKTDAMKLLQNLEDLSKDFAAILNPDHPKWNEYGSDIRKSIQVINLFNASQVRPLVLAVSKYFSVKNARITFPKLVSWTIRFIIVRLRGGRLDQGYARLANAIHNKEIKNYNQLKKSFSKTLIGDSEFKNAFGGVRISTAKQARYFLRSLEMTAREEPMPQFIPNDDIVINLEHILPLSSNEHWQHVPQNEIDSYTKRLGNMVLLQATQNSDIGNMPFSEKKKTFKDSAFELTSQVAEIDLWNSSTIDKRQEILAELAVKTWSI